MGISCHDIVHCLTQTNKITSCLNETDYIVGNMAFLYFFILVLPTTELSNIIIERIILYPPSMQSSFSSRFWSEYISGFLIWNSAKFVLTLVTSVFLNRILPIQRLIAAAGIWCSTSHSLLVRGFLKIPAFSACRALFQRESHSISEKARIDFCHCDVSIAQR